MSEVLSEAPCLCGGYWNDHCYADEDASGVARYVCGETPPHPYVQSPLAHELVALRAERDALAAALENVRLLAMRMRRTNPENADHLLRFCKSAGVVGSVTRDKEGT